MKHRVARYWLTLALPTLLACGGAPQRDAETAAILIDPFETIAGRQLTWVLSALDPGAPELTEAEVEAHFAPSFLQEVPAAEVAAGFDQLEGLMGAPMFLSFEGEVELHHLVAVVEGEDGQRWRIAIATTPHSEGRIVSSSVRLAPDLDPNLELPESWAELETALRGIADHVSFVAAELPTAEMAAGSCRAVFDAGADQPLAIASAFKLYVLAELARQIDDGRHTWEEVLAIRDDWKSIATGRLQLEEAGTEYSLREYAELMISISDNTATDHLMHVLGRESVEDMVALTGHHDPAITLPLLTTQELAVLKIQQPAGQVTEFGGMSVEQRRAFLEEQLLPFDYAVAMAGAGFWTTPRRRGVGWFASADDLCRVMGTLRDWGATESGAPVLDILSINPGTFAPPHTEVWDYVGYKGGSEPGVLNMTWLLRNRAGRWFVLSIGLSDETRAIPLEEAAKLSWGALLLLEAAIGEP